MTTEADLIERGYFPKEVQPTFVSSTFAQYGPTLATQALNAATGAQWWTVSTKHNLGRPGGLRRTLGVPNPSGYLRIARRLGAAWHTHIAPILVSSTMGASRLVASTGPRSVEAAVASDDIEPMRASQREGARYLLHADVQNFYPSIYTHAIDWAVHTKAVAKAALGATTVGSELDKAFRGSQEGQTMGISIGPDASLVVAECIMSRVEEFLRSRLPRLRGYRYWDDFELSFDSLGEAEYGLGLLQEALSEFELTLNPRKTRIVELPEAQLDPGLFEIKSWDLASNLRQRSQLIGYFDLLFRCIAAHRGGYLASYGVARLRSVTIAPANWLLVQNNLLQLLVVEPSCARYVAEILGQASAQGHVVAAAAIARAAETLAVKHGPLSHGSEVAWALWLCLAHNVAITQATAAAVSGMTDNLVALLALHARANGLVALGLNTTAWEACMTSAELRRANWLLAYEAHVKGWLPSAGGVDHIQPDAFFTLLRQNGVTFYDTGKLTIATPQPVLVGAGPMASVV
jgi:hypothetical protein